MDSIGENLVKVFVELRDAPFESESFWAKPLGNDEYELRNSNRRIPSLMAPRILIADDQNTRFVLENLSHEVVGQIPELRYFCGRVMTNEVARSIRRRVLIARNFECTGHFQFSSI